MTHNCIVDPVKHSTPDHTTTRLPAMSVRTAFTAYLDIESRPKPADLENLLHLCQSNDEDKKRLLIMSMVRIPNSQLSYCNYCQLSYYNYCHLSYSNCCQLLYCNCCQLSYGNCCQLP